MATSDFLSARRDGVRWRAGDRTCHTSGYNLLVLVQQSIARLLPAAGVASYDGFTVRGSAVRADGAWGPMSSRALYAVARAQGASEGLLAGLQTEATAQRVGPSTVATMVWVLRRNGLAQPPLAEGNDRIALPADTVYPRWSHTLPRPAGWHAATLPACTVATPGERAWPLVLEVVRTAPEVAPQPQDAPPDPTPAPAPEAPPEPELVLAGPPEPPEELAPAPPGIEIPGPPPPASPVGAGTVLLLLGGLALAGVGGWVAIRKSKERAAIRANPVRDTAMLMLESRDRTTRALTRAVAGYDRVLRAAQSLDPSDPRRALLRYADGALSRARSAVQRAQDALNLYEAQQADAMAQEAVHDIYAAWYQLGASRDNPFWDAESLMHGARSAAAQVSATARTWGLAAQRYVATEAGVYSARDLAAGAVLDARIAADQIRGMATQQRARRLDAGRLEQWAREADIAVAEAQTARQRADSAITTTVAQAEAHVARDRARAARMIFDQAYAWVFGDTAPARGLRPSEMDAMARGSSHARAEVRPNPDGPHTSVRTHPRWAEIRADMNRVAMPGSMPARDAYRRDAYAVAGLAQVALEDFAEWAIAYRFWTPAMIEAHRTAIHAAREAELASQRVARAERPDALEVAVRAVRAAYDAVLHAKEQFRHAARGVPQ